MIAGVCVGDDDDDDGDGIVEDGDGDGTVDDEDDSDVDLTGSLTVYGPSPALLISPDAATGAYIALGPARDGFGVVDRGPIVAIGVYDGFAATGVLIEGAGGSGSPCAQAMLGVPKSKKAAGTDKLTLRMRDSGFRRQKLLRRVECERPAAGGDPAAGLCFDGVSGERNIEA